MDGGLPESSTSWQYLGSTASTSFRNHGATISQTFGRAKELYSAPMPSHLAL